METLTLWVRATAAIHPRRSQVSRLGELGCQRTLSYVICRATARRNVAWKSKFWAIKVPETGDFDWDAGPSDARRRCYIAFLVYHVAAKSPVSGTWLLTSSKLPGFAS